MCSSLSGGGAGEREREPEYQGSTGEKQMMLPVVDAPRIRLFLLAFTKPSTFLTVPCLPRGYERRSHPPNYILDHDSVEKGRCHVEQP